MDNKVLCLVCNNRVDVGEMVIYDNHTMCQLCANALAKQKKEKKQWQQIPIHFKTF